ncbi:hypothetical protein [uncultured Paludibaculum sp.]|nr:hypothetical protein [uncultured Paludibaculum sp.]
MARLLIAALLALLAISDKHENASHALSIDEPRESEWLTPSP